MKTIYKIAILTGLIVSVSSCQKEEIPTPSSLPGQQLNSSQRNSGPQQNYNYEIQTGESRDSIINDVVGGGDDDRDGGGKKEPKKG